ncbi:MAG TPA: sterol desaturase family protein [Thermoanaerobaculia bacterium]|nr:sterol desaturase family protein [Thermoanaerobaculia bacterium]
MLPLIVTCAVLWSLESVFPLYANVRSRRKNLALTAAVLLTNLAFSFVTARIASIHVAAPPLIGAILALDLSTYAAHVALHKSRLAWRFHRVHHSDAHVDVTTAFRQHPAETIWRILAQWPAIVLLGIPMPALAIYLTISAVNALLEHANIRVPERLDRFARVLFVTPNMHKVHHSCDQRETDTNYANIFSIWDRVFATYTRRADFAKLRYGLGQ